MEKKELINKIAEKSNLNVSKKVIEDIVESTFDVVIESLINGDKVKINKLGSFSQKVLKGRKMKSPLLKDGILEVKDRVSVGFKPSSTLLKSLNTPIEE